MDIIYRAATQLLNDDGASAVIVGNSPLLIDPVVGKQPAPAGESNTVPFLYLDFQIFLNLYVSPRGECNNKKAATAQ